MTPQELLNKISVLSDEYYTVCEEAGQIAERKGYAWLELRKKCSTNAEADQLWAASADGRREAFLKYYIKGLSALRGSLILQLKADQGSL